MCQKKSWLVDDSPNLSESDAFDVVGLVARLADLRLQPNSDASSREDDPFR